VSNWKRIRSLPFYRERVTGSLLLIHIEILDIYRDDLLAGHAREGTATGSTGGSCPRISLGLLVHRACRGKQRLWQTRWRGITRLRGSLSSPLWATAAVSCGCRRHRHRRTPISTLPAYSWPPGNWIIRPGKRSPPLARKRSPFRRRVAPRLATGYQIVRLSNNTLGNCSLMMLYYFYLYCIIETLSI